MSYCVVVTVGVMTHHDFDYDFDLLSGCRSCFYAGWQLGGRETDRPGYRQRAGCGGGPGSYPKGTVCNTDPEPRSDV